MFILYYLRERRKFSYYNYQHYPIMNEFYFLFFKKVYLHYFFFFNSFLYKTGLSKNYSMYKSCHLVEYLWKFHFPYENTYFPIQYTKDQTMFAVENEFINKGYFHIDDFQNYTYPIEFFFFRKYIYKNSFYNFFFKNHGFFFSKKLEYITVTNDDLLSNKFFFEQKIVFLNNLPVTEEQFKFSKAEKYTNYQMYYYYIYASIVLLLNK